ncbi:MAG: zf-HC2 domain-containing protein [Thermoanaerobaculia bacterium]
MNSCPERDVLILYFLGLLNEKEKFEIEKHLKSCESCYKEYLIEKEIEKCIIYKGEPLVAEEFLVKKVMLYRSVYKFSPIFKFLGIFLTSAAIISTFFALYFIILNFLVQDFSLLKGEETKAILMLFSLFLKEISNYFYLDNLKIFYLMLGTVVFLFNLFYALKRYFMDRRFI